MELEKFELAAKALGWSMEGRNPRDVLRDSIVQMMDWIRLPAHCRRSPEKLACSKFPVSLPRSMLLALLNRRTAEAARLEWPHGLRMRFSIS